MKKVYLDGKEVDSSVINPEKHKHIGTFRPPEYGCMCPVCGLINPFLDVSFVRQHWIDGHYDVPQYVSISSETKKELFLIRRYNSGTISAEGKPDTDIIGVTYDESLAMSKKSVFCNYEKVRFIESFEPKP